MSRNRWSGSGPLLLGAGPRLAVAAIVAGALWLAFFWATSWASSS